MARSYLSTRYVRLQDQRATLDLEIDEIREALVALGQPLPEGEGSPFVEG